MTLSLASYTSKIKTAISHKGFFSPSSLKNVLFVTGNESADLDSCSSAILSAYLYTLALKHDVAPQTPRKPQLDYVVPLINIPRKDLELRPDITYMLKKTGVPKHAIAFIDDFSGESIPAFVFLVDHNRLNGTTAAIFAENNVIGVLDHHNDESYYTETAVPRTVRTTGSCMSLVVNFWRQQLGEELAQQALQKEDSVAALLALGPILADTSRLRQRVEEDDKQAATFIWAAIQEGTKDSDHSKKDVGPESVSSHIKDFDKFCKDLGSKLSDKKHDISKLSGMDLLRKDYKEWANEDASIQGYDKLPGNFKIGISTLPASLEDAWARCPGGVKEFLGDIRTWAKQRSVDLSTVMCSHKDADKNRHRELMLVASGNLTPALIDSAVAQIKDRLQLTVNPKGTEAELGAYTFEQGDLEANRKVIAPLLRNVVQGLPLDPQTPASAA